VTIILMEAVQLQVLATGHLKIKYRFLQLQSPTNGLTTLK